MRCEPVTGILYFLRHVLLISLLIGLLAFGSTYLAVFNDCSGFGLFLVGVCCYVCVICTFVSIERFPGAMPTGGHWNAVRPDCVYERGFWYLLPSCRQNTRLQKTMWLLLECLVPYCILFCIWNAIYSPYCSPENQSCSIPPRTASLVVASTVASFSIMFLPMQHMSLLRESTVKAWHDYGFTRPKPPKRLLKSLVDPVYERGSASLDGAFVVGGALVTIGVLLALGGSVVACMSQGLIKLTINNAVPVEDTSSFLYRVMADPGGESPRYTELYFWNWTNYDNYTNGEKPALEQFGPITLREVLQKENIEWTSDGENIQYDYYTDYVFIKDRSIGGVQVLDVGLGVPNFILQGAMDTIAKDYAHIQSNITDFVKQRFQQGLNPYVLTSTVAELLYGCRCHTVGSINAQFNLTLRDTNALVTPWYSSEPNMRPKTKPGKCIIKSGKNNPTENGKYVQWGGYTEVPYWGMQEANSIAGHEGVYVGAYTGGGAHHVFDDKLGRLVEYEYAEDVTVDGVSSQRYITSRDTYGNNTALKRDGFYQKGPYGVWNISKIWGAKMFVSAARFYNADLYYTSMVDIEAAIPEEDETTWDIEPRTGCTVGASVNRMTSILFDAEQMSSISIGVPVLTAYMPVYTVRSQISSPYAILHRLKLLIRFTDALPVVMLGVIVCGVFLLIIGVLLREEHKRSHRSEIELLKIRYPSHCEQPPLRVSLWVNGLQTPHSETDPLLSEDP